MRITITKLFVPPSTNSIKENVKIYKFFMINKVNVENKDIASAKIRFQVSKDWLRENNANPETVSLHRLEQDGWRELPTAHATETAQYHLYEATSPGFSTFVITAGYKELATPALEQTQTSAPQLKKSTTPPKATAQATAPPRTPTKQAGSAQELAAQTAAPITKESGNNLWLFGIILIVLIGVVYYAYYSQSKRKRPF